MLILSVVYGVFIWRYFSSFTSTISAHFGYLDTVEAWRALDDFINLKVMFKDYFYQYGWFFIFLQAIPYLIFQKTYMAMLISRFFFLPAVGVIISYFVARYILGKKYLILIFLVLSLPFRINFEYVAIRHLMAELSLAILIFSLYHKTSKGYLMAGLVGGMACLTSLEYGLALNIGVFIFFVLNWKLRMASFEKKEYRSFLLGQTIALIPFLLYLLMNGAVGNYLSFTLGYIKSFYYSSPCSPDSFPRLADAVSEIQSNSYSLFGKAIPLLFLQKLNMYIVFFFYILSTFYLAGRYYMLRKLTRTEAIASILIIYGFLIYKRTLNNPCFGYFTYSLVPFMLLLTLIVGNLVAKFKNGTTRVKIIIIVAFLFVTAWLALTEVSGITEEILVTKKVKTQLSFSTTYYPKVGAPLPNKDVKAYEEIYRYIVSRAKKSDPLFVYPWGPYNQLTNMPAPNSILNPAQFIAGERFINRTIADLEKYQPKYTIINIYNNLSIAHWGKNGAGLNRYLAVNDKKDGVIFTGIGNEVERYILSNYFPVYRNEIGVVLQRRAKPIYINNYYRKVKQITDITKEKIVLDGMKSVGTKAKYQFLRRDGKWKLVLSTPIKATDIVVELKLNANLFTRELSRYDIIAHAVVSRPGDSFADAGVISSTDWQLLRITLNGVEQINAVEITVSKNKGAIWWLLPDDLEIKKITFYGWIHD
ncbi:hypothetical protein HY214_01285 [Candidatus Roizmanbacteria bacterium]|nr:hypothetical protein [Candidatus Roizmanbacteria bacterium]